MKQFVIGEEVKVKSWSELVEEFGEGQDIESGFYCGEVYFDIEMKPLCGKGILVTEDNLRYNEIELEIKKEVWTITEDMVHFPSKEQLLFDEQLLFAKLKEGAIIPSKRLEDAGYDIYACFEEQQLTILPGETKIIPTGIVSAFSPNYYAQLKERGSTGTKGISQRCGVIDSKGLI